MYTAEQFAAARQQQMDNDPQRVLRESITERKQQTYGSRHKKNGSRSRACKMPYEFLSQKELAEKNGPIRTFAMNVPCSIETLKEQDTEIQREYLEKLIDRFHISTNRLVRMLGGDNTTTRDYLVSLKVRNHSTNVQHKNKEYQEDWDTWLSKAGWKLGYYHKPGETETTDDTDKEEIKMPQKYGKEIPALYTSGSKHKTDTVASAPVDPADPKSYIGVAPQALAPSFGNVTITPSKPDPAPEKPVIDQILEEGDDTAPQYPIDTAGLIDYCHRVSKSVPHPPTIHDNIPELSKQQLIAEEEFKKKLHESDKSATVIKEEKPVKKVEIVVHSPEQFEKLFEMIEQSNSNLEFKIDLQY